MKRIIIIILAIAFTVAVCPQVYADCTGDLAACEELLDECTGCDCAEIECPVIPESINNNDGDISLADIARIIPGWKKLDSQLRATILAALSAGLLYAVYNIPGK